MEMDGCVGIRKERKKERKKEVVSEIGGWTDNPIEIGFSGF